MKHNRTTLTAVAGSVVTCRSPPGPASQPNLRPHLRRAARRIIGSGSPSTTCSTSSSRRWRRAPVRPPRRSGWTYTLHDEKSRRQRDGHRRHGAAGQHRRPDHQPLQPGCARSRSWPRHRPRTSPSSWMTSAAAARPTTRSSSPTTLTAAPGGRIHGRPDQGARLDQQEGRVHHLPARRGLRRPAQPGLRCRHHGGWATPSPPSCPATPRPTRPTPS